MTHITQASKWMANCTNHISITARVANDMGPRCRYLLFSHYLLT